MDILDRLRGVVGDAQVLSGTDMAGYSRDWAGGLSWTPLCVVRPGSTAEVSQILQATYDAGVAVVPLAGNTSVVGGGYAEGAVMLSLERMNRVESVNTLARTVRVQGGAVIAAIHAAADDHDLVFPLLFGAQGTARIGGSLSTNAGGSNVLRYGNVRALCLGIEVVLPDGRVMDLMNALHKDNTGYDLRDLVIGAEGTLGVITGAVLKLFPKPPAYVTAMIACNTLEAALDCLTRLQATSGNAVEAFEYMPAKFIDRHLEKVPGARAPFENSHPVNILAQVAASARRDAEPGATGQSPIEARVEEVLTGLFEDGLIADAVIAKSEAERAEMWARREAAAEVLLAVKPYVDADPAVPTDKIADFIERAATAVTQADPGADACWVAHLGDGNLHYSVRISSPDMFDAVNHAIERVAMDLGGTFSAEHGIGRFMRGSMTRWKDPVALEVMRAIKDVLDPKGLMNPGKMLP